MPSPRKYITKPANTNSVLRTINVGRTQPMPFVPQYRSLERAAALETLARPKNTRTTLGKQHIEARKAEPPIHLQRDFTSVEIEPSPMRSSPASFLFKMCSIMRMRQTCSRC